MQHFTRVKLKNTCDCGHERLDHKPHSKLPGLWCTASGCLCTDFQEEEWIRLKDHRDITAHMRYALLTIVNTRAGIEDNVWQQIARKALDRVYQKEQ